MNNCRDCRNPIHHGAKKCHHCGSYQNWIRHLNTFALFTGFFLTLLSIWTIPFINGVFQFEFAYKIKYTKSRNESRNERDRA